MHKKGGFAVRVFNCHTPTSICNTFRRKEDTVLKMLTRTTVVVRNLL